MTRAFYSIGGLNAETYDARTFGLLELRWTYRYEMRHLLELSGFVVEEELSDFGGAAPAYGLEQIVTARRIDTKSTRQT